MWPTYIASTVEGVIAALLRAQRAVLGTVLGHNLGACIRTGVGKRRGKGRGHKGGDGKELELHDFNFGTPKLALYESDKIRL